MKRTLTIIRIGLALVFLANSLTAFFAPSEFIDLVGSSFITGIFHIDSSLFVILIGINDALVALLFITGIRLRYVAVWATLWIVGVMSVKGFSLDTLEESGFLFMAISLALSSRGSVAKTKSGNK